MPPKSYQVQRSGGAAAQQSNTGYARAVINELASPENRSVVTAVTMFAAGVAFLHSSWSEILLPPL